MRSLCLWSRYFLLGPNNTEQLNKIKSFPFKDCDQQIFIDFCNIFSSDFSNDLHLDFGEVALGSTGRLFLHIRNESAIAAPYTVGVEHFIARPPTPPQEPLDRNMSTGQRRALLQKTPNLADPMARTLNKATNGKKLSLSVKLLHLIIDVITANYCICLFGDEKKADYGRICIQLLKHFWKTASFLNPFQCWNGKEICGFQHCSS